MDRDSIDGAATVFAIPGDINTLTGGYRYDARLMAALRAAGREVRHLPLREGFPAPDGAALTHARAALQGVGPGEVLLVDGLAYGALDTEILTGVDAPMVVLVHHPLALEAGLSEGRARVLFERERSNLVLAARIVVPSRHVAELLTRDYGVDPVRLSVAPPGFERPPAPRPAPQTPPLILSVGILAARKGHDVLLDALGALTDLDWQAEIVGLEAEPDTAAALYRRRDALGLAGRVRFAGSIDEDALAERYARASVFALATRFEGYGMVFSEAVLHGLPIVSCRVGAVPDTVPAGAGRLVAPEDAQAFAAALRAFLTDARAHHAAAQAAGAAAAALPGWAETARAMGAALDAAALAPVVR